jgi:hypothetical protein
VKILCHKYQFNSDIEIQEVNFFTSASNNTLIQTIDLYDYIIKQSLSPIEISVETVDDNQKLFYETSNVSLKCFNKIVNDNVSLSDFFQLYTQNSYFKYLINIEYDDRVVYTGILYPENIKMLDREQEIIDLSIVGLEKEFKEYYSNKYIPSLPEFETALPTENFLPGFNSSELGYHLRNTFFTAPYITNIRLIGLGLYYIIHQPYLFRPDNKFINDEVFVKTGYRCYQRDEYNLYDFFKSICLSMGWVWYFDNREMIIRNRYDVRNFPVLEIEYNDKFEKHDVENQFSDVGGDNIMIDDGEFWSNGYLLSPTNGHTLKEVDITGNRKIVLSDKNVDTVTTNPFRQLKFISTSYEINYSDFKVYKFGEENITNINLKEVYCYPASDPTDIIEKNKSYNASMTLRVNPIINSRNQAGMINITQARTRPNGDNYGYGNYFTTVATLSDNTFAYRGNPGNCLVRYNTESTHLNENYQHYITTETFKNNFRPLLKSKLQLLLTIEYDGVLTSPSYIIKIKNYPYSNVVQDYTFSVQKIKYDLINKKTFLSIVKI